ncbi:hypothetical protein MG293_010770, partial [Ovis ammon polii]
MYRGPDHDGHQDHWDRGLRSCFLSIQYQLEEAPASHVRRRMSGSNQREPWRAEEIPQLLPAHHFQCLTSISTEELA